MHRSMKGFTLLELLTVLTIIAILSTIALVGYQHKVKTAREAVLRENIFQLNHALEQHRADRGRLGGCEFPSIFPHHSIG